MKKQLPIIVRSKARIGYPAAEDDESFLFDNFIDTQSYEIAIDFENPQFLIVGRTGTGKSAILKKIETTFDNIVRINPKDLSLKYVSNSNLVTTYQGMGLNLDVVYEFLWRHILAVELLKARYSLDDEARTKNFLDTVINSIRPQRKRAFEYLREYGSDFWLDIDSRTTEIIKKIEQDVEAEIGANTPALKAGTRASETVSEQERVEVVHRAQKILDSLRIQELSEVINWLSEDIFDDPKQKFFVLIDDLDEQFASDPIRLNLIKALILTIKKFRTIRNVRVLAVIRTDLLESVFENTRSSGFQEEKFEANVNITSWDRASLRALVERRISYLYKHKYTSYNIVFEDIFAADINDQDTFSYILDRTLMRPRDIIAFINECLEQSVQRTSVTAQVVRKAEASYSARRYNALKDEWIILYPLLDIYTSFLLNQPRKFALGSVSEETAEMIMLQLVANEKANDDVVGRAANRLGSIAGTNREEFMFELLQALFATGIIFIKTQSSSEYRSPTTGKQLLNRSDVDQNTILFVHPMLWQKFNTQVY